MLWTHYRGSYGCYQVFRHETMDLARLWAWMLFSKKKRGAPGHGRYQAMWLAMLGRIQVATRSHAREAPCDFGGVKCAYSSVLYDF